VAKGTATAKGKRLLKDFVFVPECKALDFIESQCSFDWNTQTLGVNVMDLNILAFPKGATHLGLTVGVLDFDFEGLKHTMHLSHTVYLENNRPVGGFTLQPDPIMSPKHTGLAVLGLQFVEVRDTEVYVLKTMKACGCAVIAVE